MNVTSTLGLAGLLTLGLATTAAAETADLVAEGEAVFTQVCFACHYATKPEPTMAAPPIFAAKNHYADLTERADFVAAISAFVRAPSEEASRMPGALQRFGLMPPQEITEAEAIAVAEYLYATDFTLPDWYKVHYEEKHGEAPSGD
jgi:mono/diheme cytochrome c family protein